MELNTENINVSKFNIGPIGQLLEIPVIKLYRIDFY